MGASCLLKRGGEYFNIRLSGTMIEPDCRVRRLDKSGIEEHGTMACLETPRTKQFTDGIHRLMIVARNAPVHEVGIATRFNTRGCRVWEPH